jgi:hypothetical protein
MADLICDVCQTQYARAVMGEYFGGAVMEGTVIVFEPKPPLAV